MPASCFTLSRRNFLKLTGSASLALWLRPGLAAPGATGVSPRRLVFVEMNGGCDGLNTVIPYADGLYYDQRPTLAIAEQSVLALNNQIGFHPALARLHSLFNSGQVAVVQGVGHSVPDLSHFAMMDYWRSGHPDGALATGQTGWLGRLLDQLDTSDRLSGLSLSNGLGPVLASQSAIVATLTDIDPPYVPEPFQDLFWSLLTGLAAENAADATLLSTAKKGMRHSRMALDLLPGLAAGSVVYADDETAQLFDWAARILSASADVRVIHIPLPLDFDTHSDQAVTLGENFALLDSALGTFLDDLSQRNLAENTLVVLVSEFGRRVDENNSGGTDHGTASNAFIIGKRVVGGLYGQQPALSDLDDDGNLKMSLSYLDLLATVSQGWMDVSAGSILPAGQVLKLFG